MAAPIVTLASTVNCAHAGTCTPVPAGGRVLVAGSPPALATTAYTIPNCSLKPPPIPPDTTGQFVGGLSTRVMVGGVPLVLASSVGTGLPTGNPLLVVNVQTRVLAT